MRSAAQVLESIWYGRSVWRWLLWPASLLFRLLTRLRAGAYRSGLVQSVTLPVPVVVVGNITVGGTGKTPFIVWLARQLGGRGLSVGIVSRGYRGNAENWPRWVGPDDDPAEVGDEPVLLARRTRCPVVAGPDRVRAAQYLLSKAHVDVLLSDDGLQHYRMARACEIAIVDGVRGLGNGMGLPAGPLREPASRLRTVDAVVVNAGIARIGAQGDAARIGAQGDAARMDAQGDAGAAPIADTGSGAAGCRLPFRMQLAVAEVYRLVDGNGNAHGDRAALADFAQQTVHAVAGIGHPERFFRLLEQPGLDVVRHPLPDHAELQASDLRYAEPGPVMITEKDAVKCRSIAHRDVWCVAVDVSLERHESERLIQCVLERTRLPDSPPR